MASSMIAPISEGAKFGRWTVLSKASSTVYASGKYIAEHRRWSCKCECGNIRDVSEGSLKNGKSKSCGCLQKELSANNHKKHGETFGGVKSVEYKTWQAMLARCGNENNPRYSKYGGRGIKVCDRWKNFDLFLLDMGRRPTDNHSIDRIDNNQGYCRENCRWSLPHEQMTNREITRFVDVDAGKVPLATIAKQYGIPANTLRFRILKGWPLEKALRQPVRQKAKRN